MEIIWSENAIEDLRTIYLFYFYKNRNAALKIHSRIINEVNRLIKFPYIGSEESFLEEERKYRSFFIRPYYKVIYIITDNSIHIVAVWDCGRNPETLTKPFK